VIEVRRAADRFRTDQPGITSWHAFSSGAHYDPDNLAFGPVMACDEHLVDPGAGFATHPHARVELLTWVLDGALRHSGPSGRDRIVVPGRAQYQLSGSGIEHAEVNASAGEALHFVQLWLLTEEDVPDYDLGDPPLRTSTGRFDVLRAGGPLPPAASTYLHVGEGTWTVSGHELRAGDSVRATEQTLKVDGAGQLLVVSVDA
jgi:redox-sensitive bicupin YhaK (pirin superfamily)